MGASLLVFSNKRDVAGCMTDEEICKVSDGGRNEVSFLTVLGAST